MRNAALLLMVAFVTPAQADATREALEAVGRCAAIADATDRLQCYDAAAPRVKGALAAPPAPVAKGKGSFLDWFGFSPPAQKAEDFGKPVQQPGADGINSVTGNVIELARTVRGRAIWILANGQVWRQIDSDTTEVAFPPVGSTMSVTIESGALGSYNLSIAGINGIIKVNRLR